MKDYKKIEHCIDHINKTNIKDILDLVDEINYVLQNIIVYGMVHDNGKYYIKCEPTFIEQKIYWYQNRYLMKITKDIYFLYMGRMATGYKWLQLLSRNKK